MVHQDFRSEDGLYSMIQAQYDAALQNPPWEHTNTFDIDDRPRKRAKPSYFYEVVAPDGRVVDIIDETRPSSQQPEPAEQPEQGLRRSLRSQSTSTLSRLSTPSLSLSDSGDVSSRSSPPPSTAPEKASDELETGLFGNGSLQTEYSKAEVNDSQVHVHSTSVTVEIKQTSRRSSRRTSLQPDVISVEHSFISTTSTTSTDPSSSIPATEGQSVVTTTTTSIAEKSTMPISSVEVRLDEPGDSLRRQDSKSSTKPEDEDPSATQSSQSSRTLPNLRGRDLFDAIIWSDPFTTSIFYMFISSLRQKIRNEVTSTTETHNFVKVLRDGGRLVRNYTQNIDLLEERLGLLTDLSRGAGNRARFHSKTQQEARPAVINGDSPHNGGVEVVLLHGSLGQLRCGICAKLSSWDDPDREAATLSGHAPDCPQCVDHSNKRTGRGRRSLAVGRLRPDIVLYGEEHPSADLVGPLITHDLSLGPDVLLIMGTSLKVHGLKVMVKEFAKAVHTRGGKVVFVNRTKPPESTWGDVIDYWVEWDCDAWVLDLKQRRADIWLPQGTRPKTLERKDSSFDVKPATSNKLSRPQATRDDKLNGAFLSFKILDTLSKFVDDEGRPASRSVYFRQPSSRLSTSSIKVEPVKKPAQKPAPKARKSTSAVPKPKNMANPKKRKSCPGVIQAAKPNREEELKQRMMEQWTEIRRRFPALPVLPRVPLQELSANVQKLSNDVNLSGYHWGFHGGSNRFPSLIEKNPWPPDTMLISHPPSGAGQIQHSLKKPAAVPLQPPSPEETSFSRPSNHAYRTRSSRRISNDETIVVDDSLAQPNTSWSGEEDTIVVATSTETADDSKIRLPTPPQSGILTPSSQRIKRMGSIGAILSSSPSEEEFHDAVEVMT